jgi:oxygen-independent coproporphyrinogen-3 oxidase
MGLRLTEGVALSRLKSLSNQSYDSNINGLVEIGMLQIQDGLLRTTKAGRPVLNAVLRQLLSD